MKNALSTLACFKQVEQISTITSGLSQHCFRIHADNKIYFAKTLKGDTEVKVALEAAKQGLSPSVIYHDQQWLVTEFIHSENLTNATLNKSEKIHHAIKLMGLCHQLKASPIELSPEIIIDELINETPLSNQQQVELLSLAKQLIAQLKPSKNMVCCHGDLNFSNILINQEQALWLVDYECACSAPAEYDLAMFISVNNIAQDKVATIIEFYQQQFSININHHRVDAYLLFCYFINSLWYFNAFTKKKPSENAQAFLKQAEEQWQRFNSLLKTDYPQLFSRLRIKLSNILTTLDFSDQT